MTENNEPPVEDDDEDPLLAAARRGRERKEALNLKRIEKQHHSVVDPALADLVPEPQYERTKEESDLDALIRRIGIIEAYERWIHKSRVRVRPGQIENIMVSCPLPGHLDKNPDCWLNTDKNTWMCGPCNEGGDVLDIAAIRFGFKRPDYKSGKLFHELRRAIAVDYGFEVQKFNSPSLPDRIFKPEETSDPGSVESAPTAEPVLATVTQIKPIQDIVTVEEVKEEWPDDLVINFPTLNWREIVTPDTFLDTYMNVCIVDDAAEEYHFWNAMLAIGLAVGRDVTLFDSTPVHANLLLCVLGRTGDRKTRALSHLLKLLRTALPFDYSTGLSTGVKVIQGAASGEHLIFEMSQEVVDPTNPKLKIQGAPTIGLAHYGELSDLVGRSARQGSVIKSTIMEFADASPEVTTGSRTSGTIRAISPFMCLATSTQPESLKELVSSGDNTSGFLNRWVFASGKGKKKIAVGGAVIDITPAVHPLQRVHGQMRREVQWSDEAKKIFEDHFHTAIEPIKHDNPILGRLDLLEKKLILLLCINEELSIVPEEIVRKVIRMHGYLVAAYGLTAENLVYESENNKIYNDIMKVIQRLSEKDKYGPTQKNIKDRLAHKKYDKVQLERIFKLIDQQEDRVEVNEGDKSKPGRHTEHYRWVAS